MRISDDERREVAQKLRERTKKPMGKSMQRMFTETLGMYAHNIGWMNPDKATNRWDVIVNYLADLIDQPDEMRGHPTCEMKGRPGERYAVCTRCGAFVRRDAVTNCTSVIPVKFCPNCRAKVI